MASRFWVGGTGAWDNATTTHWSATSGGAGGASVPGSGDTVTFDASSGGGTVTLNFGGTITIQSLTMGAFTGTLDNSVNNNNMTLSAATGFDCDGVGVRTLKLGTATYTISSTNGAWNFSTTLNLTYTGNTGANIVFTGSDSANACRVLAGGLSHGNLSFGAPTGSGICFIQGAGSTFASLTITAPNYVRFPTSVTTTITGALAIVGTGSSPVSLSSGTVQTTATVNVASGSTGQFCALRDLTFSGTTPVFTDSFDLGNVSGATISGPSGGGGGSGAHFAATIF